MKWIRNPGLRITCATKLALHAFGGVAVFETRFTQEQTVAYTQGATLLHVLFRAVLQNRNGAVRPKCIPTDKIKKNWTLKKGWELFLDKNRLGDSHSATDKVCRRSLGPHSLAFVIC